MEEKKKLGEILLEAGVIDKFQLKSALAEQNKWGGRLGNHLVQMGILTEELLVKALSKQLKIPYLDLGQMQITKETLDLVPQELAEKFHLVPVAVKKIANKKTLIVAMSDPTNLDAIDELQFRTGHIIKPAVDGDTAIEMAIRKYYYGETGPMQKPGQPIDFDSANAAAPANTNNVPTSDVHSPPEETFSFGEEQTVPEPVGEASLADLGAELVPTPLDAAPEVPVQYTDPMAYAESLDAVPAPYEEPAAWHEAAPAYDENGQPIDGAAPGTDAASPAQYEAPAEAAYDPTQYDANGQPLYADVAPAVYEEPVAPEDAAAQPAYDAASGTQYDANGQPVYGGPEATAWEAPAEPTAAPTHDENGVPYETAPAWDPNAQNWDENAAAAADPNAAATAAGAWDAPAAEFPDAALTAESAAALEGIDPAAAEPTVSDGSVYDPTVAAEPWNGDAGTVEPVATIDPETAAGLVAFAADPEPPPPLQEIAPDAPPAWDGGEGAVNAPVWSDPTQPEYETAPVADGTAPVEDGSASPGVETSIEPSYPQGAAPVEPGPAEAAVDVAGSTEWNAGDAVRTDFGEQPAEPYEPTAPGEPTHAGEPATAEALAADGGAQEAPRWDPTAGTQPDAIVAPEAEALAAPELEDPLTLVPFESLEGRAIRAIAGLMIEKGLLTPEEIAARLKLFLGDGSQTPQ